MAPTSLSRRKSLSAQQTLALLHEMDAADSDGGEVLFGQQLDDASSEESEMEMEQEPNMPPQKMRRGTGKPCPTESAKRKITSVLQSFLCLLDVGMLLTITECTVHQARRTEPDWKLTIHELMAFISILFVRAIMCPVGAIVDCWSENFLVPVIKETMSRNRFLSIMQHLRFDDKDTRAERLKTDRFAAISDIWTRFTKNCAESFTPGEHMTINEQLFPTLVRCPLTQYIGMDQMARMYSVRATTRRWPVAVFYNMLDLVAVNAYVLYKACTGWKGKRRLFLSLLAKELRCQFTQQKEMETERDAAAAFAAVVPGPVQTTQCQVQESCNRNHSKFVCVKCHKFTCAKCRDDGHWVCKRCEHRL